MLKDHKCIVFAIEHYNPLGIVRSLGREGIFPDVIAVKGKASVVAASRYVQKFFQVQTVEEGFQILLKEYAKDCDSFVKPVVYCSDDKTIGYLDLHYDEIKDKFIFFQAGRQGRINEYMDKYKILECARKYGLKTLDACACRKGEIPENLSYPVITKAISPNTGGWKSDVHICESEKELEQAYQSIQADTVLIQKYIDKKNEYCLEGFSIQKGRDIFISIASTYNYLLKGYYSPYMTVTNMNHEFLKQALGKVLEEIGFEGIFEIEFLIGQDDTLYFSEVNFRNSTWSWASTIAGMNLPVLWGEAMLQNVIGDIYKKLPENFTGMVEPIDYGKRVETGKISYAQWLAEFKDADVTYYYDRQDTAPFYVMMENRTLLS